MHEKRTNLILFLRVSSLARLHERIHLTQGALRGCYEAQRSRWSLAELSQAFYEVIKKRMKP